MKYAFIHEQRQCHRITRLCNVLGVSRGDYYAWRHRPPSARERSNTRLLEKIRVVHHEHRRSCGSDKTWHLLKRQGETCGRHRVARLRREHGIEANRMKRFRGGYAARNSEPAAENVLDRQFTTDRPDTVWVADTTFIPTRLGWLYLAIILDLYSRQIVGWAMSNRNNRQLVCDALNMAIARR